MRNIDNTLTSLGAIASFTALLAISACSGADFEQDAAEQDVGQVAQALTEDALAEAFELFKREFINNGQHIIHNIGFGFHPGLSTTKIVANQVPVNGLITVTFEEGKVEATLHGPDTARFDLWFLKNAVGTGTVKPETSDTFLKVGQFALSSSVPNRHTLSANIGASGVNFDLDTVVVTQRDQHPTSNVVAVGARTLFEKRFFRERAGRSLDPVTGTLSNTVETKDPLVRRGSQLFFNEKFAGNGRTCGTCHRLENNLTIDEAFISTLPSTDPLFAGPGGLEDPFLLARGLIRENVDGFDAPVNKFVQRHTPHTLAMSTSIGRGDVAIFPGDGPPPDQRTGWGGDGSPGRGTLNEFAFGAIVQHFTKTLGRVPETDFRIPTQAEVDALEAFQLFSGRQRNRIAVALDYSDPAAESGKDLFIFPGRCDFCHRDVLGSNVNLMIDTGVENLNIPFRTATNMPKDRGFGVVGNITDGFGNGRFNVPPLFEAADTPPFFHNGAVASIEDAVKFYTEPAFRASPGGTQFTGPIDMTQTQINELGAFLRVINALENIVAVRKRIQFIQANRSSGNTTILKVAIEDTKDAIDVLSVSTLSSQAVAASLHALRTLRLTLENALGVPDGERPAYMSNALVWLGLGRSNLFTANPQNEF